MTQVEPKDHQADEDATLEGRSIENKPSEVPEAISISVVSNSKLLREGLVALLATRLNLQFIGAYSGKVNPKVLLPNPPGHVVLIDSGLGRADTVLWTRNWHEAVPAAHVLILELADEVGLILECIEAGATGYTLQGASISEVSEAITAIVAGLAYLSPKLTAQLFARLTALSETIALFTPPPVTIRELEVLHHIAMGCSNLEIANRLSVALPTVKQHVHHILRKLNTKSRTEAARFASEQGWLVPHQLQSMKQNSDAINGNGPDGEMHRQIHLAAHER